MRNHRRHDGAGRPARPSAPLGPTALEWNDARYRAGYIRSPSTHRAARWHIRKLTEYLGAETPIDEITADELGMWLECLADDGIQPRSRNTIMGTIRPFFAWAARQGYTDDDPAAELRNVRPPRRVVRAVPAHHVSLILDHADLRTQAIIVLLVQLGYRRGEVARIRWEDYDRDTGILLIDQGKGCRDRTTVLMREPAEALDAWWRHCMERRRPVDGPLVAGPVFPGQDPTESMSPGRLYTLVVEASHAVGLHYSPHQYRHTCATEWTRAGVPSITLARQLGHADVSTTQIYADVDVEDLRPHVAPKRYYRGKWAGVSPGQHTVG